MDLRTSLLIYEKRLSEINDRDAATPRSTKLLVSRRLENNKNNVLILALGLTPRSCQKVWRISKFFYYKKVK